MNYKLIMLPNPILVTSKEETVVDDFIWTSNIPIERVKSIDKNYSTQKGYEWLFEVYGSRNQYKSCEVKGKIIAGIEGLPSLDLSAIAEEIGWVDVEKLAKEYDKSSCRHFRREHTSPLTYDGIEDGIVIGFKAAQSLNEKKYTNEHMLVIRNRIVSMLPVGEVNAWDMIKTVKEFTNWLDEYVESLSKPKEYNVEVDTHRPTLYSDDGLDYQGDLEPKITNNTIKVTKIL